MMINVVSGALALKLLCAVAAVSPSETALAPGALTARGPETAAGSGLRGGRQKDLVVRLDFTDLARWVEDTARLRGDAAQKLRASSRWIVTFTNLDEEKGAANLRGIAPVALLAAPDPWPGNALKLFAFREAMSAMPPAAEVLLTDCCDVAILHDPFQRFRELRSSAGAGPAPEVVFASGRSYAMLTGNDDFGVRGNRHRQHHHEPGDVPPSPLMVSAGVPDTCPEDTPNRCLHNKFLNAGTVIGVAARLQEVYSAAWSDCEQCRLWQASPRNHSMVGTSEENYLMHYVHGVSHQCQGRCLIDYSMRVFFFSFGWQAADFSAGAGGVRLALPGTSEKVAFDPAVVHVTGLGNDYKPSELLAEKLGTLLHLDLVHKLQSFHAL